MKMLAEMQQRYRMDLIAEARVIVDLRRPVMQIFL